MSNLKEIKQHIIKLKDILIEMPDKAVTMIMAAALAVSTQGFTMVKGAVPELIDRFKKSGRNFIIGGVIGGIGLAVLGVASLFLVWALILLLDKAIEELWLSAIIVAGAMLLGGGFFAMVGLATAWSSARKIQKAVDQTGKDAATQAIATVGDITVEVTELQTLGLREFKKRKRQVLDYLNIFYRLIPLGVAFLLFASLVIRHRWKKRSKKKALRAPVEVVFKED